MRVWRLTKPHYAPGLDGEGARLWGGRWNSPGVPMVYTAGSLALAALEYFVHLPPAMRQPGRLPPLVAVALDIPDDLPLEIGASLPTDMTASRNVGDNWIRGKDSLGLIVPSFAIPHDTNILLNPAHPDMRRITVGLTVPFTFDPRLAS